MYRSKKDVDKHVEGLFSKLSQKEFKSRAYSIARLYFEVGDYNSCQKYVEQYLSHKDNSAAAHKLLGQALQKLGQKEKALEQYKISLDLDPTQTSLLLDICEILTDNEVAVDPGRAKYWCEKAEASFPRLPITFKLREKLMAAASPNPEALVNFLTAELSIRPKDPMLHARLLKHYLENNKAKEAFEHSCNVEFTDNPFSNNCAWYETLSQILKHNAIDKKNWLYQLLNLTVRERLCVLSLTETPSGTSKSLAESTELLHLFDQAIEDVSKSGAPSGFAEFHAGLLKHHRGQFVFHAATLLLKRAKKDQLSWRDATRIAGPLMLIAWHSIPLDTKVSWLTHSPEKIKAAVNRWYVEGAYRCSQAGHYILSNAKDRHQQFLDNVAETCSGSHWKEKIYEKIFPAKDYTEKMKLSHLTSDKYNTPELRIPRRHEIEAYDSDAQKHYPNSLHHFVWTLMNYKSFENFDCSIFDMLSTKTINSINCGPETLNKLDIFAYLYCTTLTVQQKKSNQANYLTTPTTLPANITELLCALNQIKWWDCAYKFCQNQLGTELTDIRATLSRGIEVVRCVDNHGLDGELLCILGRTFREKAKTVTSEEKKNWAIRASLYYNTAIPLLEKLKSNLTIKIPKKRLFDYTHKDLSNKDINIMIEESKVYVAEMYIADDEYEKAIDLLSTLKCPQAYYHMALIFKKMALENENHNNEPNSKFTTLLSKARSNAHKALDLLKDSEEYRTKSLYPDTQALVEDIECLHGTYFNKDSNLSSTLIVDQDAKYLSDENVSSLDGDNISTHNRPNIRNVSSTPKHRLSANTTNYRTAVDSQYFDLSSQDNKYLERIENQIKNLQRRDSNITSFMEQTKSWFEENKNIGNQIMSSITGNIQNTTDQFKQLKISIDQIKDQIDECRTECKDVGELKKQIAELKKEVNKLKKTSSEQTIDDNDLYNLEDEYRTNENVSNFAAQLPFANPQMMSQFNQRLVPPFPVPPNPYQLYGQGLYNLYNQYSQFSQAPPVPAPPIFDATRSQLNYPGMYSGPEQMYADVSHLIPPPSAVPTIPTVPTIPVSVPPIPVPSLPVSVPPIPVSIPPISTTVPPPTVPKSISGGTKEASRPLPVNVVITSSDPLPTSTTAPQPVLSVTIPTKHIKGTPHNYQIQMPATSDTSSSTLNTGVLGNTPFPTWNSPSVFKTSSLSQGSNASTDITGASLLNTPKTSIFDNAGSHAMENAGISPNTSLNKSRTLSERSNTSVDNYDPCPDFKPIVPLPAEVKVTTGEEDEVAIFSARAKLFRFADKQWKERGIGEMKLLKHKSSGKVRVLMRREQVHKICANHLITPEMDIQPMKNETKAYFWVANDFADETVVLEKFCIRFKTAEIAKQFYDAFEKARIEAKSNSLDNSSFATPKRPDVNTLKGDDSKTSESQPGKTVVGGFTFTSTPTFKTVQEEKTIVQQTEPTLNKANPFSALSFKSNTSSPFSNLLNISNNQNNNTDSKNLAPKLETPKLNTSDTVEEFEPTVEFKPVIPLPALVDHKTGEEDEVVLVEYRAKLFKFVSTTKEWKERGIGNIKLLVHKDNQQKLRLLMRRDQVMKVCCNHAVTKDMTFKKMPNLDKAVTWCAMDYSEGDLVSETLCLRFKTTDICNEFVAAIELAQSKLSGNTSEQQDKGEENVEAGGFGDKFKPKPGSWNCQSCYTNNLESFLKCACCEQPNPNRVGSSGQTEAKPVIAEAPKFSFGIPTQAVSITQPVVSKTPVSSWGDKFKPKEGTWECKQCFVRNEDKLDQCSACASAKDPTAPKKDTKSTPHFSFGIPSATVNTDRTISTTQPLISTPVSSWGDKFKPKEGTWECKQCFVRNEGDLDQCSACAGPKDPNAPKKETKITSNFSFGIPTSTTNTIKTNQETSIFDGTGTHKFSFGIPSTTQNSIFGSEFPKGPTGVIFATPKKADQNTAPLNFSLKNNDDSSVTITPVKPPLLPTPTVPEKDGIKPFGGKESNTFDFVFKPKPPSKGKSPVKSPKSEKGEESDDNEYASEDEGHHIHFSPVIPMPDKINVVTGEEDEDEVYAHRAKLYRFVNTEWKERGRGIVRVLKHKETGKLRVVMRREQVLKICLNHALTADIKYTPKDEKTWFFVAHDFSEQELNLQHFCIRFQSKEVASEFKAAVDNARGIVNETEPENKEDNDDVLFVTEIQASQEDKQRATELMLPENFFTYKNKEPCRGCRGCESDEDVKPLSSVITSSVCTPTKTNNSSFFSPANSVYGTPTAISKEQQQLDKSSNSNKPSIFSLNSKNIFNANDKENTLSTQTNIFGGSGDQKTIFSSFSSAATTTPSESDRKTTKSAILAAPKLSTINSSNETTTENKNPPTSIFGKESASSVFGNVTNTENKSDLNSSTTSTKSIFGTGSSLFGTPKSESESQAKNLFATAVQSNMFGPPADNASKTSNIFTSGVKSSIFGAAADSTSKTNNIFTTGIQKNSFGAPGDSAPKTGNLFNTGIQNTGLSVSGNNQNKPLNWTFGSGASMFDNSQKSSIFGFKPKDDESKVDQNTKDSGETKKDSPFKIDNTLSFEALSSSGPGFNQKQADFQWEGAGQQLFKAENNAGQKSTNKDENTSQDGTEAGTGADEEYDPHYEPIVPLPDKIVVTTGEEDEEKVFSERCKLYRYDEKGRVWKERGVGEMKLLYHPERKTYRLLLRREQVYKAVLNMLLFMDLELLPMKNSDRAWTWAGINYAENAAGEQETLAVRFKSVELAEAFRDRVVECVRKMQAAAAAAINEQREAQAATVTIAPLRLPKHLEDSARADPVPLVQPEPTNSQSTAQQSTDQPDGKTNGVTSSPSKEVKPHVHFQEPQEEGAEDDEDYDQAYEDYENYEDYYNEEEEAATYYTCEGEVHIQQGETSIRCPEAQIQVMFDQEVYSPKILVTDTATGEILADLLIHIETEFQMSGDSCTWSGTDYTTNEPTDKTVTVNFPDTETALMFYDSCETSKGATYSSTDPES